MKPDTNSCPDPFSLPMNDLADAQTLVRAIESLLGHRGLSLRPPPPVPTTCCGRGCAGCVWQGYYAALRFWQDQARALLSKLGDGREDAATAAAAAQTISPPERSERDTRTILAME